MRGPFGTPWPRGRRRGRRRRRGGRRDRPRAAAARDLPPAREPRALRQGRVLYGGRSPGELLYPGELERWRGRFDVQVEVTVDSAPAGWRGRVGVVTTLVPRADFDPDDAVAMVCGPEVMMRFAVAALAERGVAAERIFVSLERSMKLRDRALRPLPAAASCSSARTARCSRWTPSSRCCGCGSCDRAARAGRRSRSGSSPPATAASSACSTSRTSCWRSPARSRSPTSSRPAAGRSRAPTTSRSSRARSRRAEDAERIQMVREQSRRLVTIGACATAGGIQALRNFADVEDFLVGGLRVARVRLDARPPRPRSPTTCTSTSSCRAARSTSASCSR